MPCYRYYFSTSPGDPSPRNDGLQSVTAESTEAAVTALLREGRLPSNQEGLWIHFLVWTDQEGQQRGFESIRLSQLIKADSTQ